MHLGGYRTRTRGFRHQEAVSQPLISCGGLELTLYGSNNSHRTAKLGGPVTVKVSYKGPFLGCSLPRATLQLEIPMHVTQNASRGPVDGTTGKKENGRGRLTASLWPEITYTGMMLTGGHMD